jgi:hypothetical protein
MAPDRTIKYLLTVLWIAEAESMMIKPFLELLRSLVGISPISSARIKPDSLTLYTQEMADRMDELLAGVVVDEDE